MEVLLIFNSQDKRLMLFFGDWRMDSITILWFVLVLIVLGLPEWVAFMFRTVPFSDCFFTIARTAIFVGGGFRKRSTKPALLSFIDYIIHHDLCRMSGNICLLSKSVRELCFEAL